VDFLFQFNEEMENLWGYNYFPTEGCELCCFELWGFCNFRGDDMRREIVRVQEIKGEKKNKSFSTSLISIYRLERKIISSIVEISHYMPVFKPVRFRGCLCIKSHANTTNTDHTV
jgi:hypothetical protein